MAKVVTKYEIEVIEYDSTGYYYPKYKTIQKIISESLEEAKAEAIKRTPMKHKFGSTWVQSAKVKTSEDIIIDAWFDQNTRLEGESVKDEYIVQVPKKYRSCKWNGMRVQIIEDQGDRVLTINNKGKRLRFNKKCLKNI